MKLKEIKFIQMGEKEEDKWRLENSWFDDQSQKISL